MVKTADDFGSQGEPPSHPATARLAGRRFPRERLGHQAVLPADAACRRDLSAVALTTPEKLAKDPENRLLAGARASAWMPRWCAITRWPRAGCLAPADRRAEREAVPARGRLGSGGDGRQRTRASTSRTQATGCTAAACTRSGSAARRPPRMDIFNAPTREICTVRRERTEHAAAGAGDDERRAVRGGGARSGRSVRCNSGGLNDRAAARFRWRRLLARPFDDREAKVAARRLHDFLSVLRRAIRRTQRNCSTDGERSRIRRSARPNSRP